MGRKWPDIGATLLPALAIGLFAGRVAGELWPGRAANLGLAWPVLVTVVAAAGSGWWLRGQPARVTWTALLLLVYVFYPVVDPAVAAATALVAALAGLLVSGVLDARGQSTRAAFAAAALVGALFLAVYVATVAPDLLPADSGELQLVAARLGVAHPPGFPLYTMAANLASRLPLAPTPAARVNLFSTLTSAATVAIVYLTAFLLTRWQVAAAAAAVTLGFSTTFWAQATTANIRSLTALFAALMLFTVILHRQQMRAREDGSQVDKGRGRALIAFGLVTGLGLSHHASLIFLAAVCVLFLLVCDPALMTSPRRWLWPLAAFLVGLLPLIYLPLRASADVPGASPGLATVSGFLNHVLALGFRGDFFYFIEPAALWQRLKVMATVMEFQFSPWLLLVMGLGLAAALWRDWRLALLLGGAFGLHTFITATYRAPQTVEYMLPAYIPAVLCLGYGMGVLRPAGQFVAGGAPAPAGRGPRPAIAALLVAITLTAALWQGWRHWPSYRWLHQTLDTRQTAAELLAQAPPAALLLAHWHWATPIWYLQQVEGQRPDVEVRFVFPTAETYSDTWARRVEAGLAEGRDVISTHFESAAFARLPPPEPVGEGFLFRQASPATLPAGFQPLDIQLGETLRLRGYRLEPAVEIGQTATLMLAWQAAAADLTSAHLFAQLASAAGAVYAQQDVDLAPMLAAAPAGADEPPLRVTALPLTPRPGAAAGPYRLLVGAYGDEPWPDEAGETRTAIGMLAVTAMSRPPLTQNRFWRALTGVGAGRRLIGYDWDMTLPESPRLYLHWHDDDGYETEVVDDWAAAREEMPAYAGPWGWPRRQWSDLDAAGAGYYVPLGQGLVWTGGMVDATAALAPGSRVELEPQFAAAGPVLRDLAVSVRLIGYEPDGFHWAWWDLNDSIPALGAIPTLKWIGGSQVRDPHEVTVSETAPAGQTIGAILTLYDAFSNRPLPILDERLTGEAPWIPLGLTRVQSVSE